MNRIQFLGVTLVIVGLAGMLLGTVEIAVASPAVTFGLLVVPVAFLFFLSYHAATYLGYA
jgi:type IV secretory pathway VirB3-like protein